MKDKIIEQLKKRRLLIAISVLFFVLLATILYNTFSEKTTSTIWDGTIAKKFASGDGSVKKPYVIENGSELAYFFTVINGEESTKYYSKSYVIKNNIDLNGYDFSFARFDKPFSGVLNGNGYTISHFELNNGYLNETGDELNYSIFDSLFNANVKNINFQDITINVDKIEKEEVKEEPKEEIKEETKVEESKEETKVEESKDESKKEEPVKEEKIEEVKSEPIAMLLADDIKADDDETTVELKETETPKEEEPKETETPKEEEPTEVETPKEEEPTEDDDSSIGVSSNDNDTPKEEPKEEKPKEVETPKEEEPKEEPTEVETPKEEEPEKTETPNEDELEEDEVEDKVEVIKINVGLIRETEHSNITNISLNGIKINIKEKDVEVRSSIFILDDMKENNIRNISISNADSSDKNSTLFIEHYDGSVFENIVYKSSLLSVMGDYDIKSDDSVYKYVIKNNKILFENDYSTNAMLDLLNYNSDIKWKVQDNIFRLQNNGKNEVSKKTRSALRANAPSGHTSGVDGSIVYVNDYESDANYYAGLNYTYSSNGTLPTTVDKDIYNDSNLVYMEIHYYGTDFYSRYAGNVSPSESANQYVYYKVFPVNNNGTGNNTDDYVEFDLIDNPFSKNPNNRVFQGWLTNYLDAKISLDTDVYVRSVKVPVTYSDTTPDNININFYAVWGVGVVRNYATSWSDTFSYLKADGFTAISTATYTHDISGFYIYSNIRNNAYYPDGAVNASGVALTGRCSVQGNGRCYFYQPATGSYSSTTTYYLLVGGTMTPSTVPETLSYTSEIPDGESIAGYYRYVNIPRTTPLAGYFDSSGNTLTSGTCTTSSGCNYYELIQFYDANSSPEVFTPGDIIYYKTTRDTNRVVMNSNISNVWGSSQNKPFTFTAVQGNTNNINSYYWDARQLQIRAYNDIRIENMRVYGVSRIDDDTTPVVRGRSSSGWSSSYSSEPAYNSMYCSYHNCKIGRGIRSYNTSTVSFDYIVGGNMTSNSSVTRYSFILESGIYNNLGVTTTGASTSYLSTFTVYVDANATFGNDYDRVTESNPMNSSNLDVMYCLSGSWFGNVRGADITTVMLKTLIKSGRFGSNKADYAAGVYVGGRNSGSHYSPRQVIVEGGYIYNLIGGPLSRTDIKTYNDSYIYMKGGYADIIIGGAGRSETYGNRIIQVTGGRVNYAVFGGSNGIEGDDSQYTSTVDGDSYVYIGGNAVIGDPTLVAQGAEETESKVEAGSVFGIGNGRSGYSKIGTVNNSNVIIDGDAVIHKNVYGGGNHGATGQNGSNKTYTTKILIHGGTVDGSVYGGGNNNGAGSTSNTCNINITMDAGQVTGSVYGGSRTKGRIYGNATVHIEGGRVSTDVYGGGEGGYQDQTNFGTFVNGNIEVVIGTSTTSPYIGRSVYGGSAYGSVNCTDINPSANSKTVNVTVNSGTVVDSVFGGAKGSSSRTPYVPGQITVNINGGTISKVFGGFDEAGKPAKDPLVYIDGGQITDVYGGGNKTSVDNTHIYMRNGSVTTIYGGSNQSGTVLTTTVDVSGGTTGTVFGGNNEGGTCNSTTVNITGGRINTAVYGGGNLVSTGTTTINMYNATNTIPNMYGGGNRAGATTTNVNLLSRSGSNNISITNVYGGSNQSGVVTTSNVNVHKGSLGTVYGGGSSVGVTTTNVKLFNDNTATIGTIYGGSNQQGDVGTSNVEINAGGATTVYGANNAGGVTTSANVTLNNGTVGTIFGGGNVAVATNTHVVINNGNIPLIYGGGNAAAVTNSTTVDVYKPSGTITSIYGGGEAAGAGETHINIDPGSNNLNVNYIYGGSNRSGVVTSTDVEVNAGTIIGLYGGNNAGGSTTSTSVHVINGNIGEVFGGGNFAASGNTTVDIDNGTITSVYGGGNQAIAANTSVNIDNGTITTVFGGGNRASVEAASTTIQDGTITTLYGGGNAASVNLGASITMTGGEVTGDIFGGGNQGIVVGNTTVHIEDATVGTAIYAGGNGATAHVNGSTELKVYGSEVTHNIYGGGNNGKVYGNTQVYVNDSEINGSAYAGGNGQDAYVFGNTTITVGGASVIGTQNCTLLSSCSVFGGGNAARTGSDTTNNSVARVRIAGATVWGNVYGGANTSKVFGATEVDIGNDVSTTEELTSGDVVIHGTVFGGGEANASGSPVYDWTFVGVTRGITVNINGANRTDFRILGSIFGSGNASTAAGTSTITIKNYGTFANPKENVSIQRTNLLTIDNSAIHLAGATDRENEYSDVLFTLSRIDRLDLKNGSTIYLDTGANLLRDFRSLKANGDPNTVTINKNQGTVTYDVNNRVYMLVGKKLNIANNENVTDYGEVTGMAFFGMYKISGNGTINTGIYGDFAYDAALDSGGVFYNTSSYVLGLHKEDHNIQVDGFYTNYIDEATHKNKMDYITPTPPTGPLYMWVIGESIIEYEIDLSASKYSTLGTTELSLRDFTDPNTSFVIDGFDYSDLDGDVSLVEKTNIKKIADTNAIADTVMGLSMETSNVGWLNNGYTSFLTRANDKIIGTHEYVGGSSYGAPSVLFYLHHSKNISTPGDIGSVIITLKSIRQIDALNKETKTLMITVNLSRTLFDTVNYEGAMTAGRKYDLFTSTTTNISSHSAISTYYSLFNAGASIYRTGYHRTLVSNYSFPVNTKITMIDLSKENPEYYYHIINATDVANADDQIRQNSEAAYNLSMFEVMGALNSGVYYDDVAKNTEYCISGNYCNEDFIFIVDFADTTITDNALNNQLLIEIRNNTEDTIYSVLAPQHIELMYNIYKDKDAVIDISGTIDKNKIYSGETFIADLHIDYTQSTVGSATIYDTHYFDSKLGIKISLLKANGDVVKGMAMLGMYYVIDEVSYYPNIDGTTRVKVADKVDSAEKWIIVNTGTMSIASGNYKLRVETFGSPDGIYYGLNSSDYVDFDIEIVNEIYGLNFTAPAEDMMIDAVTGNNVNGTNTISYYVRYNSGLTDPHIFFKMYRRLYTHPEDTDYELIDAADYFTNAFVYGNEENEYEIISTPVDEMTYTFNLGDDLMTGTYKMQFILYDGNSPIGTVDRYIIIK